jgi:exosortase E/protease (VPEID-CTERM system)
MASVSAPIESRVAAPAATESRLLWRIAALAAVLCAELLLISARVNHFAFQNASGLPGLLHDLGPWKLRIPVTLAVVALLFWQAKGKQNAKRILAQPLGEGIAWFWLMAHAAAILLFAWLGSILLSLPPQGVLLDGLIFLALLAGVAAVVLGALAFLPAAVWREIFRGTGDGWAYVIVLGAGACVAATVASRIWYPLARWTLFLSAAMLRPFLPGLVANPADRTLGLPNFILEVAPACSGYEGIGLILVFTTACLWFLRKEWRFPRALLLIPIGVAAIWFFNAVRIAVLVLIGSRVSPEVAMQGFHSHAGWILFNVVALGSCLVARRVSWLTTAGRNEELSAVREEHNAVAAYLMPFLAILAAGLLAGAASSGFEWLYALRVIASAGAIWYFLRTYRTLNRRVGWTAIGAGALVFLLWIGFERMLGTPTSSIPAPLAHATAFSRNVWILFRILGAVVTVPIAEELAFRGFLLRRLASADFESVAWNRLQWLPFVISSIAFGLLHGERWLAGTLAGMIYALVLVRRGRIGEAVIAHAVTNALLAAWVLSTGQWQLW